MTDRNENRSRQRADLRERDQRAQMSHAEVKKATSGRVRELIRELQAHQLELQQQNEQLRDAEIALVEVRDRYLDLYNFAPIGYVTVDKDGTILETNLTAATMLGVERQEMLGATFAK